MAVASHEIPISRDDVYEWHKDWKRASNNPNFETTWEDYLGEKIDELQLQDPYVDTAERDDYQDNQVHIKDLILADMDSYGF